MFRLFNIFSVGGRKLLLLKGTYDLRTNQLQGQWEQVASAYLRIVPRSMRFEQYLGQISEEQEYTISGVILEGDVTIQAPEGYELHPEYNPPYTDNVGWERTITLYPDENNVIELCTIRVRLNASELGTYNGKIVHSSQNLSDLYVTLTGETIEEPEPVYTTIKFGYLYNWYATQGTGNASIISAAMEALGWRVANKATDWTTLRNYVDPTSTGWSSGTNSLITILKDIGTDVFNFNLKQAYGRIYNTGLFSSSTFIITGGASDTPFVLGTFTNASFEQYASALLPSIRKTGGGVRPVRDATLQDSLLADGQSAAPFTGIDGKIYRTVKIGNQVWLADNLAETKYRNLTDIPEVTGDSDWIALTTGALCAYNNDPANV